MDFVVFYIESVTPQNLIGDSKSEWEANMKTLINTDSFDDVKPNLEQHLPSDVVVKVMGPLEKIVKGDTNEMKEDAMVSYILCSV